MEEQEYNPGQNTNQPKSEGRNLFYIVIAVVIVVLLIFFIYNYFTRPKVVNTETGRLKSRAQESKEDKEGILDEMAEEGGQVDMEEGDSVQYADEDGDYSEAGTETEEAAEDNWLDSISPAQAPASPKTSSRTPTVVESKPEPKPVTPAKAAAKAAVGKTPKTEPVSKNPKIEPANLKGKAGSRPKETGVSKNLLDL